MAGTSMNGFLAVTEVCGGGRATWPALQNSGEWDDGKALPALSASVRTGWRPRIGL